MKRNTLVTFALLAAALTTVRAEASPPSLRTLDSARRRHFRNLVVQEKGPFFTPHGRAVRNRLKFSEWLHRLIGEVEVYGRTIPLRDARHAQLVRALQVLGSDLESGRRILGGRRNLHQIYRGLVRIGIQSIGHLADGSERSLRNARKLEPVRLGAIENMGMAHALLSQIRPALLKKTELEGFRRAQIDRQRIGQVARRVGVLQKFGAR